MKVSLKINKQDSLHVWTRLCDTSIQIYRQYCMLAGILVGARTEIDNVHLREIDTRDITLALKLLIKAIHKGNSLLLEEALPRRQFI